MSGIENARKAVNEEALPKSKAVKRGAEDIVETSRSTVDFLALAKKGIEEHVLPHLFAAIGTEEIFPSIHMNAAQNTIDVNRAARAALGDNVELSEAIVSTMRNFQGMIRQDTLNHRMTFGFLKEDTERLQSIGEHLDLMSQHFSDVAHNTSEHIPPLDNIIDRLENFEV